MKDKVVVVNTAPFIHLARAGRLEVLLDVYKEVYSPTGVEEELLFPAQARSFLETYVKVKATTNKAAEEELARKQRKLGKGEIQSYILYREIEADELLFANTKAQRILSGLGAKVRDLIHLPGLDRDSKIFIHQQEIDKYHLDLWNANYQTKELEGELRRRGLI